MECGLRHKLITIIYAIQIIYAMYIAMYFLMELIDLNAIIK